MALFLIPHGSFFAPVGSFFYIYHLARFISKQTPSPDSNWATEAYMNILIIDRRGQCRAFSLFLFFIERLREDTRRGFVQPPFSRMSQKVMPDPVHARP